MSIKAFNILTLPIVIASPKGVPARRSACFCRNSLCKRYGTQAWQSRLLWDCFVIPQLRDSSQ
jgi:hypothetical protein